MYTCPNCNVTSHNPEDKYYGYCNNCGEFTRNRIPIFGLTGGIGSGKSTVRYFLQQCGEIVLDADELAREVVKIGSEPLQKIAVQFGSQVLTLNGELDRQALGSIVFSDPYKLKLLEGITHPAIESLFKSLVLKAQLDGQSRLFYEVPLLFENRLDNQFKSTILVTCPIEDRITRVMARNGISRDDVCKRIDAQLSDLDKSKRSTYVIRNDSDLESLHQKTLQIRDSIISHYF